MIDLHSHILPELDDGAASWEQALEMARVAVADGVTEVVCTPHWVPGKFDNSRPVIMEQVETCRRLLAEAQIPLKVHPGAELRIDINLPGLIKNRQVLTVNDGGVYALIELPDESIPDHLDEFFWNLELLRIRPIISHVERNAVLREEPHRLYHWAVNGYLAQITASSLTEHFSEEIQDFAVFILEHRLAQMLVSDGHGLRSRSPRLSAGLAVAAQILGAQTARRMVWDVPRQILNGEAVRFPEPVPIDEPRRIDIFDYLPKRFGDKIKSLLK